MLHPPTIGIKHYTAELVRAFQLQFKQSVVLGQQGGRTEFDITPRAEKLVPFEGIGS
jgi:hypothetical protein